METCAWGKCDQKITTRVEGYAECGWDGGFVYQLYCDEHAAVVKELDVRVADALEETGKTGSENWIKAGDQLCHFTGLEYVTQIAPIERDR